MLQANMLVEELRQPVDLAADLTRAGHLAMVRCNMIVKGVLVHVHLKAVGLIVRNYK